MTSYYERLKEDRAQSGMPESPEAEACVRQTVESLLSQTTDAKRPGMLLGKIQSGKTRAFLA
ncbi:MAG: hypothetical protein Q8L54_06225 [Devosia sp.]|nr:hypothetical protein [Devosia sp.]